MFHFKRPVKKRLIALSAGLLLCLTGCAVPQPADPSADSSAEAEAGSYAFRETGLQGSDYLIDNGRIFFAENASVYRMKADGTEKTELYKAAEPKISGLLLGGERLFFWYDINGADPRFCSVSADGGSLQTVKWDGYIVLTDPVYADGHLYFQADREDNKEHILCSSLPDGSDIRELFRVDAKTSGLSLEHLDPSGWIVFTESRNDGSASDKTFHIRPDGSGLTESQEIVGCSRSVFVIGEDKRLCRAPCCRTQSKDAISEYPTLSALDHAVDGWVYAFQNRGGGTAIKRALVRMREDGKDPQVLLTLDSNEHTAGTLLSVDGGKVYFTAGTPADYSVSQLWSMNTDGNDPQKIYECIIST